jgi:hypothetical protein
VRAKDYDAHKARALAHLELVAAKVKEHRDVTPAQRKHATKLVDQYTAQLKTCPDAMAFDIIIDLWDSSDTAVDAFKAKLALIGVTVAHTFIHTGVLEVTGVDADKIATISHYTEVELIEANCPTHALAPIDKKAVDKLIASSTTIPSGVWGLDRIDQVSATGDGSAFSASGDGTGVTIYVVDTGIRGTHNDFGTRTGNAVDCTVDPCVVSSSQNNDAHGHGTHCASTAGGSDYGVAKNANIIGVKVLGDDGYGYTTWTNRGVEWAVSHAATNGLKWARHGP